MKTNMFTSLIVLTTVLAVDAKPSTTEIELSTTEIDNSEVTAETVPTEGSDTLSDTNSRSHLIGELLGEFEKPFTPSLAPNVAGEDLISFITSLIHSLVQEKFNHTMSTLAHLTANNNGISAINLNETVVVTEQEPPVVTKEVADDGKLKSTNTLQQPIYLIIHPPEPYFYGVPPLQNSLYYGPALPYHYHHQGMTPVIKYRADH